MKSRFILFFVISFVLLGVFSVKADDKLTPEEIITKHLNSIGTKEKRTEIKNQLAIGVSEFSILQGVKSKVIGNAVIASESAKIFFGANYNSPSYPAEKVSFDGDKVSVAFISPGLRSSLGNFVFNNKQIFSEGLFGGTLSTSWAMLDLEAKKAKINNSGRKKVDGQEVYILEYSPKRGSDASIKLFFDAQTFQHIRTEYRQTFSAAQGVATTNEQGRNVDNSAKQLESRHILTEEFSAYSTENGLTLPHKYRIHLLLDGRGSSEYEWKFEFSNFLFNQKLDPKSFDVNAE